MSIEKSTMKGLGIAAAIVAFLASQFWGVPYYIRSEVADQVKALNADAQTPTEITELVTQMEAVETSIVRIDGSVVRVEGKIDNLSGLFIGYLERQASE